MATERRLSALLGEFARTLLTDIPIQGILDRLVVRIAEVWSDGIALSAAMYPVKRSAGGRHAVIDLREHRSVNHQVRLNHDLRGALLREELSVHYPPIVATNGGRIDTDTDHRRGSHGY